MDLPKTWDHHPSPWTGYFRSRLPSSGSDLSEVSTTASLSDVSSVPTSLNPTPHSTPVLPQVRPPEDASSFESPRPEPPTLSGAPNVETRMGTRTPASGPCSSVIPTETRAPLVAAGDDELSPATLVAAGDDVEHSFVSSASEHTSDSQLSSATDAGAPEPVWDWRGKETELEALERWDEGLRPTATTITDGVR